MIKLKYVLENHVPAMHTFHQPIDISHSYNQQSRKQKDIDFEQKKSNFDALSFKRTKRHL